MIFGFYTNRSRRDISTRAGLSVYMLESITHELIHLGWARRKGDHLELVKLSTIKTDENHHLIRHLINTKMTRHRVEYKQFKLYAYAQILKFGTIRQYQAMFKSLGRKNRNNDTIKALLRKADAKHYEVNQSSRSTARLLDVSKDTALRILKRMAAAGHIRISSNKRTLARIPHGSWDAFKSAYLGNGHIYFTRNAADLIVYEHRGISIDFLF